MSKRGTIIAFSGAFASGTGAVSGAVAERLGWTHVRFSDFIRREAERIGRDPDDRRVLQTLGQQLVQERLEEFVQSVLALAAWTPGQNLILDGLRHAEVHVELRKQLGPETGLHVVHLEMKPELRADRAKSVEGIDAAMFATYDGHVTEAQIERVLPAYAELILDAAQDRDKLIELVLRRFGEPERALDDRGEAISQMEPLRIASDSRKRAELTEIAVTLLSESKDFSAELPVGLRRPLADLVRAMNCYYSNLIENHDTHPIDIERALRADYSTEPEKRDLQKEAIAHIAVQAWIDAGGLCDRTPTAQSAILEIHERFCANLPDALLWVENPTTHETWRVVGGCLRKQDVKVGDHTPPSPGSLSRFLQRFEGAYARLSQLELILAAPAAHHRLLWIHPFTDGNGRVARLMSHAMLLEALNTHSIWSVARGLARSERLYKEHLASCDQTRRNDLDGRGNLSDEALAAFSKFFLERCIDQVRFMRSLMKLDDLRLRIGIWVDEQAALGRLPSSVARLLNTLLVEGEITPRAAAEILALASDAADQVLGTLSEVGLIRLDETKLSFAFPASLGPRLIPGLFP
jgi:Fic family protein